MSRVSELIGDVGWSLGGGGLFWMRFLLRGHIGTVLLIATIVQFLLQHFDGVP